MISRCARISTVIILSRVDILRFLQRCHNEKNAKYFFSKICNRIIFFSNFA